MDLSSKLEIDLEQFNRLPHIGMVPNDVTYSTMINGLCEERQLEKATGMWKKRICSSVVTSNTLMSCFCENIESSKVVELLHIMVEKHASSDATTFSIVIELLSKAEKYCECLNLLPTFLPNN